MRGSLNIRASIIIDRRLWLYLVVVQQFGAAGHASKIKPVSMEVMQARYASGELDPKVS